MHTEAGGRRSVCHPVKLNFCFQKGGGGGVCSCGVLCTYDFFYHEPI